MRILIASHFYLPQKEGGAERVARRTAEVLVDKGHDVSVLAVRPKGQGPASATDAPIPVHRIDYTYDVPGIGPMDKGPVAKLAWHLRNGRGGADVDQLAQTLDALKPDVIYAHNHRLLEPDLSRLAHARGIPVVLHLHDYGWLCPRNSMFRKGRSCGSPCFDCRMLTAPWRKAARPSDVIAVSDFVQNKYQSNTVFPDARWHVVRNTVTDVAGTMRAKQIKTFGFIGALAPDKGIEDLIEAFAHVPDATLRVAGSGAADFTAHLKARAAALNLTGRITWLGQVNKADFYKDVDCVVVPSRWDEPQSLVLGEALSYQRPLVVSDRGGSTEVLTATDGGLLFDPDTAGSLAQVLNDMTTRDPNSFACDLTGVLPDEAQFTARVEAILQGATSS